MAANKWIQCVVDDETFEFHQARRKRLGLSWKDYIMGALDADVKRAQWRDAKRGQRQDKPNSAKLPAERS